MATDAPVRVSYAMKITSAEGGDPLRWSRLGRPVHDDGADEGYRPMIEGIGDLEFGFMEWQVPLTELSTLEVAILHEAGELWSIVDSDFLSEAEVDLWLAFDHGDGKGFRFDSSSDRRRWRGRITEESIELEQYQGRFTVHQRRERYLSRKYPRTTVDVDRYPYAPTASQGKLITAGIGVAAGSGVIFLQPICIAAGEPGAPFPLNLTAWRILDTQDADGNDTLETDEVDGSRYTALAHGIPEFLVNGSTMGSVRVIAQSSFDSERRFLNWIKDEAHTVTQAMVLLPNATTMTFIPNLPLRDPEDDPTTSGTDAFGRAIRADISPEADIVMIQGSGQIVKNPDGDPKTAAVHNPPARMVAYWIMNRWSGWPEDEMHLPSFFSAAEWPGGPGEQTDLGIECATWLSQETELRESLGKLLFEADGCEVWDGEDSRLEGLLLTPPTTLQATFGPEQIKSIRIVNSRFSPKFSVAIVRDHGAVPEAEQYLEATFSMEREDAEALGRMGRLEWNYDTLWPVLVNASVTPPDTSKLEDWTVRKLEWLARRSLTVEVELELTGNEFLALKHLRHNHGVGIWWDAPNPRFAQFGLTQAWISEQDVEQFRLTWVGLSPDTQRIRFRAIRVSGSYAKYIDSPASAVFPASLGGGSAAVWDAGWSLAQKHYAKTHYGYHLDPATGRADPTDPDSELASVYGG